MIEKVLKTKSAPGRPRKPETQQDIIQAAYAILIEEGYRALTMERLAARAGVGKSTVYRRWKSKFELICAVLDEANNSWQMPSTEFESLPDGLRALYRNWVAGMNGAGKVIPVLIAEAVQDVDLADLLHQRFILPRRNVAIQIVSNAINRGELCGNTDATTAIDMFMGRMWYRKLVTGEEVSIDDEDKVIGLLLRGLTGPAGV